jgi:hypothetical protein
MIQICIYTYKYGAQICIYTYEYGAHNNGPWSSLYVLKSVCRYSDVDIGAFGALLGVVVRIYNYTNIYIYIYR